MSVPSPVSEEKADCYSAGERSAMEWGQRLREYWLRPILMRLASARVQPDHLTLASLISGLLFCPLYGSSPSLAFVALGLHVVLDGLDGPLARHTHVASRRGSFTDTVCDQLVVIATTVTLMASPGHPIGIVAGSMYISLYTLVVVFAMVRNAMQVPYSWLVRPRFAVYAWMVIESFVWPGTINFLIWACNLLLAHRLATGYFRIRKSL